MCFWSSLWCHQLPCSSCFQVIIYEEKQIKYSDTHRLYNYVVMSTILSDQVEHQGLPTHGWNLSLTESLLPNCSYTLHSRRWMKFLQWRVIHSNHIDACMHAYLNRDGHYFTSYWLIFLNSWPHSCEMLSSLNLHNSCTRSVNCSEHKLAIDSLPSL